MSYTERFSEAYELLDAIDPGQRAPSTFATPWCLIEEFHRCVALIQTGAMAAGATVDAALREATSAAGAGAQNIKTITQLTQAGGDADSQVCMELRSEELTVNTGYCYIQLQIQVAVNNAYVSAFLFGDTARHKPVGVTAWAEVVG